MVKISPSVLTADFLTLKNDIAKLEAAGVDFIFLDFDSRLESAYP